MKILYLDFDGVLHDEEVYFHPRRGIYINTPGRSLFEWMPILDDLLAPHPEVKIVLSTSWVRVRNYTYSRKQLSPSLQSRVIGATFHSRFMRGNDFTKQSRGVQILDDVFRRQPSSWFAIDDEYMGWPDQYMSQLVCTDGRFGISDPLIQFSIREMLKHL